ncbi:DUF1810 domain-containing protein [Mycobacterium sp. URHB0044]|jgi:uncharacterized protein (DUF1810 family)|uniref:DUF1810 domain-containing protein n=1 Tax=Mycobacterium sp. URHB0044 TaxID=1380386 RepID=UPI00048CBEB8|nr:DUF1810 domain-containing protein [Mycobacterium sp. URHB0044]
MADPYDLARFVEAQEPVYADVVDELRAGRKRSHWMWFIFPQLRDLGRSPAAKHYGIGSRDEAVAYLAHDVLGPRIRECARLVAAAPGGSAERVMGQVDALKLRSSMTLFAAVADDDRDFVAVLERFYDGERDPLTVELLG